MNDSKLPDGNGTQINRVLSEEVQNYWKEKLAKKDQELKDKDQELKDKDQELKDKDQELKDKDQELKEKDQELREVSQRLESKEAELDKETKDHKASRQQYQAYIASLDRRLMKLECSPEPGKVSEPKTLSSLIKQATITATPKYKLYQQLQEPSYKNPEGLDGPPEKSRLALCEKVVPVVLAYKNLEGQVGYRSALKLTEAAVISLDRRIKDGGPEHYAFGEFFQPLYFIFRELTDIAYRNPESYSLHSWQQNIFKILDGVDALEVAGDPLQTLDNIQSAADILNKELEAFGGFKEGRYGVCSKATESVL